MKPLTLPTLRRYAIARSLGKPSSLAQAIRRLGFVQADPIRSPARAQDLTLRHRVTDYRAGDLESRYARLNVDEEYFVNYGFMPRELAALMHPRKPVKPWSIARQKRAQALREYTAQQDPRGRGVHPREVDAHFQLGKVRNWFGGATNATTQLLDEMQYLGMLRVARRDGGIRLYASATHHERDTAASEVPNRLDALIDIIVAKYAPLPAASLGLLLTHLKGGIPQWANERKAALARAVQSQRFAHAELDGITWYWPAGENPASSRWRLDDELRLLAPFDPIVWDRRRFELFWGWAYRFEAYTPAPRRKMGYYAMPVLLGDQVQGWANASLRDGGLHIKFGQIDGDVPPQPAKPVQREIERMTAFLGLAR